MNIDIQTIGQGFEKNPKKCFASVIFVRAKKVLNLN